ncbi:MAG: metallophosphoesterase [Gloeomargaritaceae cyanobacterium C42_A2020_066]|nr:metallophosphoesterase [Gloeomargaritaceae cyanobacterium C42_A2020_066]
MRMGLGVILGMILAVVAYGIEVGLRAPTPLPQPGATAVQVPPAPEPLPPETETLIAQLGGTQRLVDPPRGDLRMVVISDLNSAYGSTDYTPEVDMAMKLIPFWRPDMVLCSGDMVAGQSPTLSRAQIQAMWAAFDQHVAAPLRRLKLPYGFTMGNHDASSARSTSGKFLFQQERDLASAYWRNPKHDPGVQFIDRYEFPFYYTFRYRDAFFLAWDGSSDYIPPDKLAWVEKALASPAAQQAKIRVLIGHLPLYSVAIGRNDPGEVMRNADQLRAMLEKYRVHTYISGHHHAYYPAHRGKLQLLHMGILGAGPRPLIAGNSPPFRALTVLDINFKSPNLTTYTTYRMPSLELVDIKTLPRMLQGHNGMVLRRDVQPTALSREEIAACVEQLDAQRCGLREDWDVATQTLRPAGV